MHTFNDNATNVRAGWNIDGFTCPLLLWGSIMPLTYMPRQTNELYTTALVKVNEPSKMAVS